MFNLKSFHSEKFYRKRFILQHVLLCFDKVLAEVNVFIQHLQIYVFLLMMIIIFKKYVKLFEKIFCPWFQPRATVFLLVFKIENQLFLHGCPFGCFKSWSYGFRQSCYYKHSFGFPQVKRTWLSEPPFLLSAVTPFWAFTNFV